ncbi:MAG TPA: Rnf-Nqr domain containing protein [Oscillospiraceae bacterium]|nr:Rnf-Nqr domain containing protein [Oscillospiraceae bacterium]
MSYIFSLLSTAVLVGVVQNLVFSGGLGASEALRMSVKPKLLLEFSIFISMFSVALSVSCYFLDTIPEFNELSLYYHYLAYIGILIVLYIISVCIALISKASKSLISRLAVAAFNTLVLAVPMINRLSGFTVYEAVGSGLGAGAAFGFAVLLMNISAKRIKENDDIPKAFKGSPALFIYAALISLGLYALSGRALLI